MKFLIIFCLLNVSLSFAQEVKTECDAMNESRQKVDKGMKTKIKMSKGTTAK